MSQEAVGRGELGWGDGGHDHGSFGSTSPITAAESIGGTQRMKRSITMPLLNGRHPSVGAVALWLLCCC